MNFEIPDFQTFSNGWIYNYSFRYIARSRCRYRSSVDKSTVSTSTSRYCRSSKRYSVASRSTPTTLVCMIFYGDSDQTTDTTTNFTTGSISWFPTITSQPQDTTRKWIFKQHIHQHSTTKLTGNIGKVTLSQIKHTQCASFWKHHAIGYVKEKPSHHPWADIVEKRWS